MVTGLHAGRYHSPVAEYGLSPVVLVFVREVPEADKPLFELLKKLDELIVKHPNVPFGCCAILLNDAGLREALEKSGEDYNKKFAETTVAKEDLEKRLRGIAKAKGIERVTFALDQSTGPKAYQFDDKADVTVLTYNRHTIINRRTFGKDKLTSMDVKAIAAEAEKVIAEEESKLRRRTR